MTSPYLTLDEVAEKLGVEYKTVYRLVRNGELPAGRVGRVYRIDRSDLDAYFEKQKQAVANNSAGASASAGRAIGAGWTCPTCSERYHSELSVGGRCEETNEPICQACWHIRRVRSTTTPPAEAAAPAARSGAGAAGRATSAPPVNGRSSRNGVAMDPPAQVPDGAVTRDQAAVLSAALIRRFGQRLESLDQFTHPLSGQSVCIDKARIKHAVEDAAAPALGEPGGPASCFMLKWGGWGKPKSSLALECRLLSRQDKLEREGYDLQPITTREVLPLLESLADLDSKDDHLFHVLLLSSPTGFETGVHDMVLGQGTHSAFHDRHLAVVLHDTTSGQTVIPDDDRLADLMPLIDPVGYASRLEAACEPIAQNARDLGSIALADAIDLLEGDAKLARDVLSKLGQANDLALDDLPGVGLVLSRR